MRWQLMLAQLAQPVMSKEGARDYQRVLDSLFQATESREEREGAVEQAKDQFEDLMGFSFVRTSKGEANA